MCNIPEKITNIEDYKIEPEKEVLRLCVSYKIEGRKFPLFPKQLYEDLCSISLSQKKILHNLKFINKTV